MRNEPLYIIHWIDEADVKAADARLGDRLSRRIVNHNEAILKIDCALSEAPRFEHHNHQDEYLIGSVLIADSVNQVEIAHTEPNVGKIPLLDRRIKEPGCRSRPRQASKICSQC